MRDVGIVGCVDGDGGAVAQVPGPSCDGAVGRAGEVIKEDGVARAARPAVGEVGLGHGVDHHLFGQPSEAVVGVAGVEGHGVCSGHGVHMDGVLQDGGASVAEVPEPAADIVWRGCREGCLLTLAGGVGVNGHGGRGQGYDGDLVGYRVLASVLVGDKEDDIIGSCCAVCMLWVLCGGEVAVAQVPVPCGDGGPGGAEEEGWLTQASGFGRPGEVYGGLVGHQYLAGDGVVAEQAAGVGGDHQGDIV